MGSAEQSHQSLLSGKQCSGRYTRTILSVFRFLDSRNKYAFPNETLSPNSIMWQQLCQGVAKSPDDCTAAGVAHFLLLNKDRRHQTLLDWLRNPHSSLDSLTCVAGERQP